MEGLIIIGAFLIFVFSYAAGKKDGENTGRKSLLKHAIGNKSDTIVTYKSEFQTFYVHLKVLDESQVVVRQSAWGSRIDLK